MNINKELEDIERRMKILASYANTEITCALCNIHVCFVYGGDLNGTYVFCDKCRDENH